MTEARDLKEEVRRSILARQEGPVSMSVEKGHVVRFAQAIGDPNPLWNDEAQARGSRYGGLIAPPTFLRALHLELVDLPELDSHPHMLDGGSEWDYYEPVHVRDTITGVLRVVDVRERTTRLGTTIFITTEAVYTNQLGQRVATQRNTLIRY